MRITLMGNLLANIPTPSEAVLESILQCFQRMVMSRSGLDHLGPVLQTVVSTALDSRDANSSITKLAFSVVETYVRQANAYRGTEDPTGSAMIDSTLFGILPTLAAVFSNNQGQLKFDVGSLLIELCSALPEEQTDKAIPLWALEIREGLKDVYGSKIGTSQRDMSLILAATMFRRFGSRWGFTDQQIQNARTSRLSVEQFVALLIHVACGELRVLLDDLPVNSVTTPESQFVAITPVCCEIVDYSMRGLVEENGPISISVDVLLSIREALHEAFTAISAYLLEEMAEYRSENDIGVLDNVVTASCLRALSSWLAEDDTLSPHEIRHIVPLLVLAGRRRMNSVGVHPMEFLGPAFVNITTDPEIGNIFVDEGGCAMVVDFWSILDSQSPLRLTLVSILLNIVATNRKAVSADRKFIDATRLLLRDLVEFDHSAKQDGLTLRASMTTLSLMILRELNSDQVESNRLTVEGLLEQGLSFILDGCKASLGKDQQAWEEVKELWLIAVAAFKDCMIKISAAASTISQNPKLACLVDMRRNPQLGLEMRDALANLQISSPG
ncbi:hypothetical protein, variant [Spizellomyces punctatus DAOM BR117]|nr:hypothetical protein, variant [Spizellomyces punctatus DAOM BR117]KNC96797.1 hypothetical protein, variant [Spizellomyces punctatus DAOM BR117]|eukprot:XP_016604837.1 hypothetical protein, variant [Spizellomyces punctatus DAOM BR117]